MKYNGLTFTLEAINYLIFKVLLRKDLYQVGSSPMNEVDTGLVSVK